MRVLVSGSTGFIGSHLVSALEADGHETLRLVRRGGRSGPGEVRWNPDDDLIDREAIRGLDAVVHLAGESIMGRWTDVKRRAILRSRVKPTRFLSEVLASLAKPPSTFVVASAVGYYGSRGDEVLTEESLPGGDFLAKVCREWEGATEAASAHGIRVVHARFGVVLGPDGGALQKMITPFRLGLGGPMGDGSHYVSWIGIDDAVGALQFMLRDSSIAGPVNVVSPNPVTNREFAETLAKTLGRPAFLGVPRFVLKAALGEMVDETLLASQRVNPRMLTQHEYMYKDPQLEGALRRMLAPESPAAS